MQPEKGWKGVGSQESEMKGKREISIEHYYSDIANIPFFSTSQAPGILCSPNSSQARSLGV